MCGCPVEGGCSVKEGIIHKKKGVLTKKLLEQGCINLEKFYLKWISSAGAEKFVKTPKKMKKYLEKMKKIFYKVIENS